tara:strand:- start:3452 stop:3559 length:108 start_codon:yes stop_codon:yes gene_type:complete
MIKKKVKRKPLWKAFKKKHPEKKVTGKRVNRKKKS